jgi:hypothetical protein
MPRRPPLVRRWSTAATWPVGMVLTSWDYMWRSTPMRRRETVLSEPVRDCTGPPFPPAVSRDEVQGADRGEGPLFHRRYSTRVRDTDATPEELIEALRRNLNRAAPTRFARFQKVLGDGTEMALGDEYVVRMPGPWDGPVRVIDTGPRSFRLATLEGHLEAGQIEFRAGEGEGGEMTVEIESWARSSSRLSNLLYHHLRMSKEVQAHMWISFLEGAVRLARGKMSGGVVIETERIEMGARAD